VAKKPDIATDPHGQKILFLSFRPSVKVRAVRGKKPDIATDPHGQKILFLSFRPSVKVRAVRGKKTRYSHGPTRTKDLILVFTSVPSVAKFSFFHLSTSKKSL